MGETHKVIGELKLKLDLRQLLDGYEDIGIRQRKLKGDRFIDIERDDSPVTVNVNVSDRRSKTINQHGEGDNYGGDGVKGNKIG
jgi:internalin A